MGLKKIEDYRTVNKYAINLVNQIANLRKGKFLDEDIKASPINMCIGVAGYPEKHFERSLYHILNQKIYYRI